MQGAVNDSLLRGLVERLGQEPQPRHEVHDHGGAVIPQRDVQRLARREVADEIGLDFVESGLDRRRQGLVGRHADDQPREALDHLVRPFGRQAGAEGLDSNGLARLGVFCAENGAGRAGTELVQHTKAADGRGRDVEQ